ncbi:hypothetical protein K440DRAFT_625450 [Wilcoxina mikolae CBS 423.85]|nr:hypothetical protein K440DRAFT_625450 [Wilcoxina mikolae CBS 423.85]
MTCHDGGEPAEVAKKTVAVLVFTTALPRSSSPSSVFLTIPRKTDPGNTHPVNRYYPTPPYSMSADPNLKNLNLEQPVETTIHFSPTAPPPPAPQVLGGEIPNTIQNNLTATRTTPKRALSPGGADSSLVLLPKVAATGRPAGSRRPFQRRRRSRACDACRARKTKCDTPDQGPCSACAAASLVCKFSEGGEDRRRAGPAR